MNCLLNPSTAVSQDAYPTTREGRKGFWFSRLFVLEKVCRSCRKNRRGAAVVEFAIVAPIFFLLIFGMIEFGRVVMVQQLLTNASREGARLGVLNDSTSTQVKDKVVSYLAATNITVAAS